MGYISEQIQSSCVSQMGYYNRFNMFFLLRYANRAKNIKNKATINEDPKDALLREFQNEIEKLKKQLADGNIKLRLVLFIYLFLA